MMATGITYLDDVVNVVVGCTRGCPECWAREVVRRQALNSSLNLTPEQRERMKQFLPTFLPQRLDVLKKIPKGSVVGVCFTGDLFDPAVDNGVRTNKSIPPAFDQRPDCTFVFLTKQYERIGTCSMVRVRPNWFLGVSCRDQGELDAAASHLRRLAAAGWRTWLSLEPLRGPVDCTPVFRSRSVESRIEGKTRQFYVAGISGVILGGPSGPNAWPIDPDWVRTVRDQCALAGVPFFFKQWGLTLLNAANPPEYLRDQRGLPGIDGRVHDALPWRLRKRMKCLA